MSSSSPVAGLEAGSADAALPRIVGGAPGVAPEIIFSGSGVRAWDPEMEARYWQRVKDKATAMALDIVTRAKQDAVLLREQAVREGYAEGQARAQEEFERAFESMSGAFGRALSAAQSQGAALGAAWKADCADLVRLAVEKVLNVELDARRAEVLESLVDQSLETADSLRRLTLVVHPMDAELLESVLEQAKAVHAGLDRWRIRHDANMTAGGVLLETEHGLVDNRLETRLAAVAGILDQLGVSTETAPAPASDDLLPAVE